VWYFLARERIGLVKSPIGRRELPAVRNFALSLREAHMQSGQTDRGTRPQPQSSGALFPDTSWTLLRHASLRSPEATEAISEFTERYYGAVTAYISAIVRDRSYAEELTQQFFLTIVLTGRLVSRADRATGSFRPYLKQSIRNFVIDDHRRRERTHEWFQLDGRLEAVKATGHIDDPAPDALLIREWASGIVKMALARVETMSKERGQEVHFQLFALRFLGECDGLAPWKGVGAAFGLDEKAARSRAEVIVRRFRAVLWDLIVTDVGSETDFEAELRSLMRTL
jgi:DNA-directed RNA polymerase specialized sigma24 family protein